MSESSGEEAEFTMEDNGGATVEAEEGDRKRSANRGISYAEDDNDDDDDDDDSDDDIPLAQLAKASKKAAPASTNGKKKAPPAKKPTPAKKKLPPSKSQSSSNTSTNVGSSNGEKKYEFASAALYQTDSLKGQLIQKLLCRWWYAYQWPDPTSLPVTPPKNYDALDGFPGVYVCTRGEDVGKLQDLRDKSQCPSFANFASKPASELKELLLKALQNQKAQLVQREGEGTETEKDLKEIIKWTNKLDPSKADKQALKVLKASRLKL